ncbi:Manganese ABC transporter, periplasmic-binding protein SitA [hydrothermal vent metagenome]|uniref:Manganese ABC transporter, periplasmic-binding protein SitA n=1 Tax=hydrothermal vent metagenome TaxID=652676 RepID=A0A3B0WJ28_9ZZZZ
MNSLHPYRLFCLTLLGLLLVACSSGEVAEEDGRLQVVTTVSPLTNIIYNIGGEHIALSGIVPEGVNSHTFEPAPSDAVKLAQADLIFINGLNLEIPSLRLAEANLKEGGEIVILGEQTLSPDEFVYDFSFPKEAGNPNPHLWTNPILALKYAEIVRDKLVERDPDNAEAYRRNYDSFSARITALDEAIKATTASIPEENRKLLTYHDSFAYFAPRYGFTVIGAVQPADFSEPSAQEVANLIEQLRTEQIPAVFGSEVFPSPVLDQIGREAGVSYVDTLRDDDLPGEPGDPEHSFIGLMVYDLKIMAAALGGDPTLMDSVDVTNVTGADTAVDQAE